ncbi:cAMP-dependent protein kinase inhibitor alpha isoform X2 [Heterocephalus glaber]|uniref:cAMP-dependent protein kinase inhibitor alpha isoform X2 n=1 Tax=Heterocephalus glaber TaxID=10181 RepID=A0AAX6SS85_HETGA|nr:cAMP-dependent protein kinase inhibitor alpha isoform X2 [Heterocephalus glaber]
MRPELGGGSGSCSWQVGWGPAGADHALGPARRDCGRGCRLPGHALTRSGEGLCRRQTSQVCFQVLLKYAVICQTQHKDPT